MSITIQADSQLETLIGIARRAGELVMAGYAKHQRGEIEVGSKGAEGPVTATDREVNDFICEQLAKHFPQAAIVAEESAPSRAELRSLLVRSEVFFVDPIDGTREFINRTGEFAVQIGLVRGGALAAGVLQLPAVGTVLAGRVGQRAFAEEAGGARRMLSVSSCAKFEQARMVASRSHQPPIIAPLRRRLGIGALEPCGSVGMKVARLALGTADLYVHDGHGLKRWDTCAPEAVLSAAGGRLSDLQGIGIDYGAAELAVNGGVVASNGVLHPGVLSAVTWARREAARLRG